MKLRLTAGALALATLLGVAWWWFSPWWVLYQVRAAAERNDAEAISEVIDYPRLRESLKGELNVALAGRIRDGAARLGDLGRAGAALGVVLASTLVERVVEAMVRPEFVIRAIRDGQMVLPGVTPGAAPVGPGAGGRAPAGPGGAVSPASGDSSAARPHFQWQPERISADRLIVWVEQAEPVQLPAVAGSKFGLVFDRRGFADWKLGAVRLAPGVVASGR